MPENQKFEKAANELKEQALVKIEAYEDNSNANNHQYFEEARDKICEIYESLKDAIKELSDSEEIKRGFDKANAMAQDVLNTVKDKTNDLRQNEKFNDTLEAGKAFVADAADFVVDVCKNGYESAKNNETVQSVLRSAEDTFNDIQDDERVKSALDKAEKSVNKVGSKVCESLHKVFDKKGGE